MTVQYLVGDSREVTATIPDGSVDLIASSPPFLALRSYLPAGHASKGDEIGSEANPAAFLDTLLTLTAEWGRVLAPHGSLAIELGDTYSGSSEGAVKVPSDAGKQYKNYNAEITQYGKQMVIHSRGQTTPGGTGWPRAKSLALIPQLYAVALAYGINPLTGQPSPAGRWRVRNVIVWHRPNPAVGALGDKVRPSTSYIVVATRSAKRWFDLTAVRQPYVKPDAVYVRRDETYDSTSNRKTMGEYRAAESAGAPPLDTWTDEYDGSHDTWTLTTQPSPLAHYAMWPAKLAERLILMMCPREVCRVCGEPRRRVEGKAEYVGRNGGDTTTLHFKAQRLAEDVNQWAAVGDRTAHRTAPTLGWTDCYHGYWTSEAYRPGLVLDPFGGTGTSGAVADLHGRDAILIDIDARNADLYPRRYDEVKRALFGTPAPMPGQGVLAL